MEEKNLPLKNVGFNASHSSRLDSKKKKHALPITKGKSARVSLSHGVSW